jgi:hypothetical protein
MGREVRMVPKNWNHPKKENGRYIPLLGYSFKERLAEWNEEYLQWQKGFKPSFGTEEKWIPRDKREMEMTYEDYAGEKPLKEHFMPEWDPEEKTHFQMYENTSEGTPVSPVFDNIESLAHWLADNNVPSFADITSTYEQWLSAIKNQNNISMVITSQGIQSGVNGLE